MTSEQLKAIIASYWRYVRQCPVVAFEVSSTLSSYSDDEKADVMALDKRRLLIETEVKVSLRDLRRDHKKVKHRAFSSDGARYPHSDFDFGEGARYPVAYFYFAVPRDIANEAIPVCEQYYPYAGVLGSDGSDEFGVSVYREARLLSGKRLTFPQALRMTFGQSATVCRLANKVSELTQALERRDKELKEYRDLKKLEGD